MSHSGLAHVPNEPVAVELFADVAFKVIEKAIDRLESYRETSQSSGDKTNGDPS